MTCHLTQIPIPEDEDTERAYFKHWYKVNKRLLSVNQTNFLDLMISNGYLITLHSHKINPGFGAKARIPANEARVNINQGDIDVSITLYF